LFHITLHTSLRVLLQLCPQTSCSGFDPPPRTGVVLEADSETKYKARQAHTAPLLQGLLGPGFVVPGLEGVAASTKKADSSSKSRKVESAQGAGGGGAGAGGEVQDGDSRSPGGARLVNREDVGVYVHIFSHIRWVLLG